MILNLVRLCFDLDQHANRCERFARISRLLGGLLAGVLLIDVIDDWTYWGTSMEWLYVFVTVVHGLIVVIEFWVMILCRRRAAVIRAMIRDIKKLALVKSPELALFLAD